MRCLDDVYETWEACEIDEDRGFSYTLEMAMIVKAWNQGRFKATRIRS